MITWAGSRGVACPEPFSLADSSVQVHFSAKARQGQPPVFRDTLQTKTSRDREEPLRNGDMHNNMVLKEGLKVLHLGQQAAVRESNTGPGLSI